MKSRFKFRVWSKQEKCYYFWDELGKQLGRVYYEDPKHYITQQFTGLLDKNNKEIFEGDIVIYTKVQSNLFGITALCKWSALMACYEFVNERENFTFGADRWENLEVIGNIFENPNLIKNNY